MRQAVLILCNSGMSLVKVSSLYETAPVGGGRQPRYLNAVILVRNSSSPAQLLRIAKRIEALAGRRRRGIDAARPLDIDLISMRGQRIGWMKTGTQQTPPQRQLSLSYKRRRKRGWLVLPHPELHRRRFVLEPLLEVLPHWQHPVLHMSGRQLLARLPRPPGKIIRILDSSWVSCER